jgi:transcriptional regulator with XRE-family HTH domain
MPDGDLPDRLARRLRNLRVGAGLTLADLGRKSGLSRATLSRIENGEVSPTAESLARLCAVFQITMSRLLAEVEAPFTALIQAGDQPVWIDPASGFHRRSVSPPAPDLPGEVIAARLPPGAVLDYPVPPAPGVAHHLVLRHGGLSLHVDGQVHVLTPGDCLRYRLTGPSRFAACPADGAHYDLFMV